MKTLISILRLTIAMTIAIAVVPVASWAQLAPPNELGVRMCHLHLNVPDIDAAQKYWVALGGTPASHGPQPVVLFPGVLIAFAKRAPSGGTEGSIVDHVGFLVRSGSDFAKKLQAAGVQVTPDAKSHGGSFLTPEGMKVEFAEKTSLAVPLAFDSIQFLVNEPAADGGSSVSEIQSWYVQAFGAVPGVAADGTKTDTIPGVTLRFTKATSPTVTTKGRALDHFGFDIDGLETFCLRTQAAGMKLDNQYRYLPDPFSIGIAQMTDPWGTSLEMNEGYEASLQF